MAELHDLSPSSGSTRPRKRVGRGPGSGTGKTSGRGEKGQKARSGGSVHPRFEGGQMPLTRRIPKRGFTNINRVEYQVVNIRDLDRIDGEVSPESLKSAGLIGSIRKPVKVLGVGEIDKKLAVTAHKFSAGAKSKIEAAGGTVTVIGPSSSDA
ncbi:MAG: 50S ribosomal protein L15 [Gemmatimonadetes bacterium]|nr:50S ribosomal protein L15 [Gemmatimonadota bacterium]MDA1104794.1 50S ribosomal protein L15 [Gemmatimonadota bacterium]